MYELTNEKFITRTSDNATIPADDNNTDYIAYQVWLSAGNTPTAPPPPTAAELWHAYQAQAQVLLDKSDTTVLRCVEVGVPVPEAWTAYRRALRAIVGAAVGDPTQSVPVTPVYPTGT